MSDLVAWLTACYDRAEEKALVVGVSIAVHTFAPVEVDLHKDAALSWEARRWLYSKRVVAGRAKGYEGFDPPKVAEDTWPEVAEHIADHDPKWRLADIGRKRKIAAMHRPTTMTAGYGCMYCGERGACLTVRLLAEEFDGEPGYDERWRP